MPHCWVVRYSLWEPCAQPAPFLVHLCGATLKFTSDGLAQFSLFGPSIQETVQILPDTERACRRSTPHDAERIPVRARSGVRTI
jgi:hypothetical protein